MPVLLRLIALARSALRAARWFALATLVAGGVVLASTWEAGSTSRAAVLLVLCLAPGLVLLHLVTMLSALPTRLRAGSSVSRGVVVGIGLTYLLRPWYWLAVGLSFGGALVLLPLALLAILGLA